MCDITIGNSPLYTIHYGVMIPIINIIIINTIIINTIIINTIIIIIDVDIPQITVSSSQEGSPEKQPGPNIRNSVSYENFSSPSNQKKSSRKEMPDFSSAQVKGYLYKKGTFGKWEKIWMGLGHDNTLYITTNESSKKITGTILITSDTKIEKKRGSDKLPHAMLIVTGKSKETFSTNSLQDYTMWLYCLEQASAGPNDIQELLSEDEDDGGM